jgi:hypothetical protein
LGYAFILCMKELFFSYLSMNHLIHGQFPIREQIRKLNVPLPPLDVQTQIVARIEEEQKLVDANKKLIELFDRKIKAKIAEVWG